MQRQPLIERRVAASTIEVDAQPRRDASQLFGAELPPEAVAQPLALSEHALDQPSVLRRLVAVQQRTVTAQHPEQRHRNRWRRGERGVRELADDLDVPPRLETQRLQRLTRVRRAREPFRSFELHEQVRLTQPRLAHQPPHEVSCAIEGWVGHHAERLRGERDLEGVAGHHLDVRVIGRRAAQASGEAFVDLDARDERGARRKGARQDPGAATDLDDAVGAGDARPLDDLRRRCGRQEVL